MTARTDAVVDQLVFRWDAANRSGSTGFGLVAWSGDERRAQAVYRGWGTKLQVPGEMLRPGLVRVRGRNDAALLIRRSPGRDPGGRPGTVCHVLRGSARALDVATCLGLHAWDWEGSQVDLDHVRGALPQVSGAALGVTKAAGLAALRRDLPLARESLCAVVAAVLRNPGMRYSVLDRSEGNDAYLVLWGLYQVFGPVLEQHPLEWSFATYDTDDSEALRFVFVPRWPATPSHDEQRIRVDPSRGRDDRAAAVAEQLVEWHLEGVSWGDDREWEVAQALQEAHRGRAPSEAEDRLLRVAQHAIAAHKRRGPRREPPAHHPTPEAPPATSWTDETPPPVPRYAEPRIPGTEPRHAVPSDVSDNLLDQLDGGGLSHSETERLLGEIHDRFDDWQDSPRKQLCAIVLDRGLFLVASREKPGWTADKRAHDAASLYTWAVRPFAQEPWAARRLKSLLPRLWHSKDDAAQEALWEILQGGPHLSEDVWLAVCRAMSHVAAAVPEPAVSRPPASEPAVPEPAVPEPAVPEPPVGEPGLAAQPILSRLFYGDGKVAVAAPVVVVIVLFILMALLLIRACDGRGAPRPQQDEKCQGHTCQETKEPSPPQADSRQPEDSKQPEDPQRPEAQESEDSQESEDPQRREARQPEKSQPGTSSPQDSEESASQGSSTGDDSTGAGAAQ